MLMVFDKVIGKTTWRAEFYEEKGSTTLVKEREYPEKVSNF